MATKLEISRIQNRRGYRRDLPQPLNPGELGLCIDTAQIYMGASETESLLANHTGLELYRPSPLGGQTEANELKNRVLIGDTVPLDISTLDYAELVDALLGVGSYLPVYDQHGNLSSGGGAYNRTLTVTDVPYVFDYDNGSDIRNTIRFMDLGEVNGNPNMHRLRIFIGIYRGDEAQPESNPVYITEDDYPIAGVPPTEGNPPVQLVQENLLAVQFRGSSLWDITEHTMVPASGSFINGVYSDGTYNGHDGLHFLDVDEYGNIAWCINRIYSLSDKGLVVSTNNIEILTDLSLGEIVNPDLTIIQAFVKIENGVTELDSQKFFLELTADRAFKMNYSLSITDSSSTGSITEEDVGMGELSISVMVDVSGDNSRLTFSDEQQFIPNSTFNTTDTHVRLVPYIGDHPDAVGTPAVLFQAINETGRTVDMRVNGIQWKAFNV